MRKTRASQEPGSDGGSDFTVREQHSGPSTAQNRVDLVLDGAIAGAHLGLGAVRASNGGLRTVGHAELAHDLANVNLDRPLPDSQSARNGLVRVTVADTLEHRFLPSREISICRTSTPGIVSCAVAFV